MPTKPFNLHVRIEPDIKEQAEDVLSTLGISVSDAINMFYKQIISNKGLPFEMKTSPKPLDIDNLSETELNEELERGYADMQLRLTKDVKQVFADIRKEYNL